MRVGVISDTHDRMPAIEQAVKIFNSHDLTAVLHCGDFVSPFSILPFKSLKAPLFAVFGNNDGEKTGLGELFSDNGWSLNDRPWSFTLNNRKIAIHHEPDGVILIAQKENYDLVVFGHTHEPTVEKHSQTLLVNPGEACGWMKGSATLAIVDLIAGEAKIEEIPL